MFQLRYWSLMFLLAVSLQSQAQGFYQDSRYIYQTTPYSESLSSHPQTEMILSTSLKVFQNYLLKLIDAGVIPKEQGSFEDLKKLSRSEKDISVAIKTIDDWTTAARRQAPYLFSGTDLLPDAFLVFGGGKFSANFGIGGGASLMLGLVVLPVQVTKIDKMTSKVVETYVSARVALVGWASPELGTGVGGGARGRLGVGMLWNFNHEFNSPEQFVGFGLGVSKSLVLGPAGINVKAGTINNVDMSGWVDFVYATAAWEFGVAATAEVHMNGTVIMPMAKIMEIINASGQQYVERQTRELEKELDEQLKALSITPVN